jgi:hypothetical protein
MTAVRQYPWLSWSWLLACIARIQNGQPLGVLQMLEQICQTNLSTFDDVIILK